MEALDNIVKAISVLKVDMSSSCDEKRESFDSKRDPKWKDYSLSPHSAVLSVWNST